MRSRRPRRPARHPIAAGDLHPAPSARPSRSASTTACCSPGATRRTTRSSRSPARCYERAQATPSIGYLGAVAQLQALARGIVAFFADYDVLLTPALAERPLPIGECNGLGENPMADLDRSGRFTPYTSLFNVTGQPAITRADRLRRPTACRPACRSSASRSARTRCSSSPRRSRRRTPGRTSGRSAATSTPSTSACGAADAQRLGVRGPALGQHRPPRAAAPRPR